ncbi:MAG: hypothetical protein HKN82_17810 [Akkermansiaceae bacterium]|nr:hypothetical protein [Akkermansiaceae bacterium]
MKRLTAISGILAMVLVLDSCALVRRTLQVPARMIRAGTRTMTGSVETPQNEAARVALRLPRQAAGQGPL